MKTSRIILEASAIALFGGIGLAQGTWWVDADAVAPGNGSRTSPYTSIHYAVHQPSVLNGDLVLVLPGRYEETVEIVDKNITLRSTEGAAHTVIDALGAGTALTVVGPRDGSTPSGTVLVEGFTITGGTGTWRDGLLTGGGVLAQNTQLLLRRSIVRANRATLGAGIAVRSSRLDLYDVELEDNQAETARAKKDGKGGALYVGVSSSFQTEAVRMRANAAGVGGGIYAEGASLDLRDTQILGNQAWGESFDGIPAQGGGVYAMDTVLSISESRIGENLAWGPNTLGGGLRVCGASQAVLEKVLVDQNAAGDWRPAGRDWVASGGGIASAVELLGYDVELRGNHATLGGGYFGVGLLYDSLVFANSAHRGGGLYGDSAVPSVEDAGCYAGSIYVENGRIRENQAFALGAAYGEGGGVWGSVVVMSSSISDNVSYGHGGGAFGATLLQSEIVGNRILPVGAFGPYYGAGVYGGYVESSLLQENEALGFGDLAAYGGGAANATLNLVEVCDNRAPFGGGAANSVIDCCTIYGNEATRECGGLYFASGGGVESSIVWKNVPDQIVDHFGVMVEYSTVQHGWPGLHNTSLNPMFWYEDSCDFNLRPGSYCIDNGDPGEQDPDGSRCDMGALPYQPDYCGTPQVYCEAEVNSSGCLPQIGFQGTPSLKGEDDFIITAANVLGGQSGLLVWGYGAGEKPFLGSNICVTGPLVRTPVQSTGGSGFPDPRCTGTMSFHLSQEYMNDHFLWHGRAIFAQYLYRDPDDPDSFGHTEGLHLVICP